MINATADHTFAIYVCIQACIQRPYIHNTCIQFTIHSQYMYVYIYACMNV